MFGCVDCGWGAALHSLPQHTLLVRACSRRIFEHALCGIRRLAAFGIELLISHASARSFAAIARPALAATALAFAAHFTRARFYPLCLADKRQCSTCRFAMAMIFTCFPVGVAALGIQSAGMAIGQWDRSYQHCGTDTRRKGQTKKPPPQSNYTLRNQMISKLET